MILGRKLKTIVNSTKGETNGNLALCTGFGEDAFLFLIAVAIEWHTRTKFPRHAVRPDAITLHTIGSETLQLTIGIDKTQSVAIGKVGDACHIERVATQFFHRSNIFAYGLRRIERGDIGLTTMQEISGITTIKSLPQVGGKGVSALPPRTATILIGIALDDLVESLTIGGCDILHIADIFETTLYLKRGGTSLDEFEQVVALIHVFQGEQITIVLHFPTLVVD